MATARAIRMDFSHFDGVESAPGGGLRIPAAVTRVGVLEYEDAEGNRWGELRPAEEVFAEDSLATLRGAPLTDLHPSALVTPETWKRVAIGHVGDDVRRDGDFVAASVIVQDGSAVERVQAGERREVSCGYECDLDETPGEYGGTPYQRVQRGIRYNHLGIGPEGWGRAGADVSLRLDGADTRVRATRLDAPRAHIQTVSGSACRAAPASTQESHMANATKQRRDGDEPPQPEKKDPPPKADAEGIEAPVGGDEAAAKVALLERLLAEALKENAELKAAKASEAAKPAPEITEGMVPEAVQDAIVAKRGALREKAAKVLPRDAKLDGLTAAEIRRRAVAHAHPTMKLDGLSDAFVEGVFESLVATVAQAAQKREDGRKQVANVLGTTSEQFEAVKREDGGPADAGASLQQKLVEAGRAPINGKGK